MSKKIIMVLGVFFILMGSSFATIEDDFNRADGALGTATNGNIWDVVYELSGSYAISNNELVFTYDGNSVESRIRLDMVDSNPVNFSIDYKIGDLAENGGFGTKFTMLNTSQYKVIECIVSASEALICNNGTSLTFDTGYVFEDTDYHTIEFRNIDYTLGKYDIYVDAVLVTLGLDLYSVDAGDFDQLVINVEFGTIGNTVSFDNFLTNGDIVLIPFFGCIDMEALNYNITANTDDGSCEYPAVVSRFSALEGITTSMFAVLGVMLTGMILLMTGDLLVLAVVGAFITLIVGIIGLLFAYVKGTFSQSVNKK